MSKLQRLIFAHLAEAYMVLGPRPLTSEEHKVIREASVKLARLNSEGSEE